MSSFIAPILALLSVLVGALASNGHEPNDRCLRHLATDDKIKIRADDGTCLKRFHRSNGDQLVMAYQKLCDRHSVFKVKVVDSLRNKVYLVADNARFLTHENINSTGHVLTAQSEQADALHSLFTLKRVEGCQVALLVDEGKFLTRVPFGEGEEEQSVFSAQDQFSPQAVFTFYRVHNDHIDLDSLKLKQ